jgi:hypothetical protein
MSRQGRVVKTAAKLGPGSAGPRPPVPADVRPGPLKLPQVCGAGRHHGRVAWPRMWATGGARRWTAKPNLR